MLQMLENELTHEKALKITQYEQQLKEESDEKAREILSTAISAAPATMWQRSPFRWCRCPMMK